MPPDPPFPIAATFNVAARLLTVTFNRALQAGPTAIANWANWADLGGGIVSRYLNTAALAIAGNVVSGVTTFIAFDPGHAQVVNYNAAPADVRGDPDGVAVPAFINFPLTLV